jgi:hypothetical protein
MRSKHQLETAIQKLGVFLNGLSSDVAQTSEARCGFATYFALRWARGYRENDPVERIIKSVQGAATSGPRETEETRQRESV